MKTIALLLITCFVGLATANRYPRIYSQRDIERLAEFSVALHYQQENILDAEIGIKVGRYCLTHSDCPPTWSCQNLLLALYDLVNSTSHAPEIPRIQRKAKIYGRECVRPVSEVLNHYPMDDLATRFREVIDDVNAILGSNERGVVKFGLDLNELSTMKFDVSSFNEPIQRVGALTPYDPSSLLFLLFAMRGKDNPSKDDTLLLVLALSSLQNPGNSIDNNMFSNPFLLFTLLGSDNSTTSNNVLLYSLLLSPNGGLGTNSLDPANTFANPLILQSLLDKNNNNMNLQDLLPLLLLGGGGSVPGQAGINGILPLLLLSNSTQIDDQLLPLLLLSGGLGGPNGGGGINDLLPLLLTSGDSSNSLKDILPLLLLGGAGGTGPNAMQSLLPLLLLSNTSLGSNSNDNNLLNLLLLSGGAGGGGLGAIAPLLLMNNNQASGKDNDLLPLLLLLGGGLGSANPAFGVLPDGSQPINPQIAANSRVQQILPLLLLLNSGSDNILLFLYIFGFLSAVPEPFMLG